MSRDTLLSTCLALLLACAAAAAPGYPCFRADVSPILDGRIDGDPAWDGLPVATGFSKLGDGYTTDKQTCFRACWDDDALYLGIVCEEPDVARMKFSIADGGDAWLDDGLEIFLQPDEITYQLVVTARGSRSCGVGAPDFTKVQAAPGTGEDSYTLEIRIPHAVVEARPVIGDTWGWNLCRNIFTKNSGGDQFTSWAPLKKQFNEPEHFGALMFKASVPDEMALKALNRQINAGYRQHLLGSIRGVAALAPEYADAIRGAVKDETFSREARDLRREWRRLERLVRQADDAPTADLRDASVGAADLQRGSYELKWHYLIHRLLEEN